MPLCLLFVSAANCRTAKIEILNAILKVSKEDKIICLGQTRVETVVWLKINGIGAHIYR